MIKIPKKDFIKEHKHLIALLEKYKKPELLKEAKDQSEELKKVIGGKNELIKKDFPENYSNEVESILDDMTFNDELILAGSASLRSQQYASDFDGYEIVKVNEPTDEQALNKLVKQFQSIVRKLQKPNIFITDIKSGEIPQMKVIDDEYDYEHSKEKINVLKEMKLISEAEAKDALDILPKKANEYDLIKAKDKIKFHILRWTPTEVLANKKKLRNGMTITLEQTFSQPAITKLDVVALIEKNRYAEFSVIYEFVNKNKVLNKVEKDLTESIEDDVKKYMVIGNYFKALKRLFSLAKIEEDKKEIERLNEILNSDLGKLNLVIGDMDTLQMVLDTKADLETIKYEIDQFKNRLSKIYTIDSYLKVEPLVLKQIKSIESIKDRKKLKDKIEVVADQLNNVLQKEAKKFV